jgi:glycerol-3-phosphate dehydrogenase (NAD(P)+)
MYIRYGKASDSLFAKLQDLPNIPVFVYIHLLMSYITVIGAGSWGSTLGALLAGKGYDVSLWTHEQPVAVEINRHKTNSVYLPGVMLPKTLRATLNSEELASSRYIINATPTQFVREIFSKLQSHIDEQAVIVSASKGIEVGSLMTPSMILKELAGNPVCVLSGPSFAAEVSAKKPTAVTLASDDVRTGLLIQEILNTDYFRVYTHDDVVGVEIGGAMKNVIAIAAGICEGMRLGHDSRAALITRGLAEISRLGVRMDAKEITFSGLSGLGDLVLTCTDEQSRNFSVGKKLGTGTRLADILSGTKSVAEGITTAISAHELAAKYSLDMPITEQVYLTLHKGKSPFEALSDLMNRSLKSEFYGY